MPTVYWIAAVTGDVMALAQRMIALRARLGNIPDRFELPNNLKCYLVDGTDFIEVTPNPVTEDVDKRQIGNPLTEEVYITQDVLMVRGLTRLIAREDIEGHDLLIGVTETDTEITGRLCRILDIDGRNLTTWTLMVKPIEDVHTVPKAAPELGQLSFDATDILGLVTL